MRSGAAGCPRLYSSLSLTTKGYPILAEKPALVFGFAARVGFDSNPFQVCARDISVRA